MPFLFNICNGLGFPCSTLVFLIIYQPVNNSTIQKELFVQLVSE